VQPSLITESIHNHTVKARECQLSLVSRTRRSTQLRDGEALAVKAHRDGFVTGIKLETLTSAASCADGEAEIVLYPSIGTYIGFGDVIAEVRAASPTALDALERAVRAGVVLERSRDIQCDPAYGIEQLVNIGWTTGSTSKHNPAAARIVIMRLRDLLARWSSDPDASEQRADVTPVVYNDDVPSMLLEALASMAIVSTESMQHQNFTEVVQTFALMLERLVPEQQDRAEDHIMRLLSTLGDEPLSAELDRALLRLVQALRSVERTNAADAVQAALDQLATTIGKLNSRSTRTQLAKQSSDQSGNQLGQ
jgi:uncharacterized membrane protein